jgi:hypothetical protein
MNPIIAPVCLIYFLITTVAEKYNLLYVYTFEYQSGGQVRRSSPNIRDQDIYLAARASGVRSVMRRALLRLIRVIS